MTGFEALGLDLRLLRLLDKKGFKAPTPVQAACIEKALQGKDVIARSKTGSGKTLAYLLPALHKIFSSTPQSQQAPWQTLILVPTKELCLQVKEETERLIKGCGIDIRVTALTLSGPSERQQFLNVGQIIVSTPGKIAHALKTNLVKSQNLQPHEGLRRSGLSSLVLDEADLILSMPGYESDLQAMAPKIPKTCQTMLMSATTNESVEKLQKLILQNPVTLDLLEANGPEALGKGDLDRKEKDESNIDHFCIHCSRQDKLLYTLALLKLNIVRKKVLLFANSIDNGFRLRLFLESFGIRSALVNAEQPLNSRHHILQQFNKGLFDYLIAIDDIKNQGVENDEVEEGNKKKSNKRKRDQDEEFGVTRGVDFKGVETVLNIDAPDTPDTYIHRVGRTGRGFHSGVAISLLTPEDAELENSIKKRIKPSQEQIAHSSEQGSITEDSIHTGLREYTRLKKASVEALRYRGEDLARSLTSRVIKEARAKDLRQELLNSQKLAAHFEANPGDKEILKHDKPLAKKVESPHLKHVPAYLRKAGGLQSTSPEIHVSMVFVNEDPTPVGSAISKKKRKIHNRGVDPIKGGFLRAPKRGDKGGALTEMEIKAEKEGKKDAKKFAKSQGKSFVPKRNVRKKR